MSVSDDFEIEEVTDDQIEVEEDTAKFADPADEGRPIATADTPTTEVTDDDLEQFVDERAKIRVKKIVAEGHAQRRRAEQAEALAQSAVEQARRERELRLSMVGVTARSARNSLTSEAQIIGAELKEAINAGDADKQIEAQNKLTKVMGQLSQIPDDETVSRDVEAERARFVQHAPPTQPPLNPKTAAWIQRNTWFDTDPDMREAAIGAANLLERRGVTPDQDEYYTRVDATLAAMFPDRIKPVTSPPPTPPKKAPLVMPVSRVQKTAEGKTRVVLSQSDLALASELGVSKEDYARELIKLRKES